MLASQAPLIVRVKYRKSILCVHEIGIWSSERRHHFSSGEAQAALGGSAAAARLALNRLARQKLVSPGFTWDIDEAALVVSSRVIEILHGDPWKSEG